MRLVTAALLLLLRTHASYASDIATHAALPPRVDCSGLTPSTLDSALAVLRAEGCPCGCNMRIAACLQKDQACGVSPRISNVLTAELRRGASLDQARKAMLTEAATDRSAKSATPNRPVLAPEQVEIPIAGEPFRGSLQARVTIVEFSDFQCPYCARAIRWVDSVATAYPNDVRIVFKQYPLSFHDHAELAAEAALAAHEQGRFWAMHDTLFAHGTALDRAAMIGWAGEIGLDVRVFTRALDERRFQRRVAEAIAEGNRVGVDGTPTFFVNGHRYNGRRSMAAIAPIIEAQRAGGSGRPALPTTRELLRVTR